ncbi:MAG: UDP-N-acetylmuramate dehydrogenase [Phycisphaerae bacterium]|nr:UDP-N-acetylmuramate dehydrogenase [Phycisphaerae bacterium]
MLALHAPQIERNAPIPTWFAIGGAADRLARPASPDELRACLDLDPDLRVLGDGANLLVDDDGIPNLVVALNQPAFTSVTFDGSRVHAGAGANLPKLILESVRRGLAGLEGLGGIPASVGGAAIMNAGGTFGQFADAVHAVHGFDRAGRPVSLARNDIPFDYRRSGLNHLVLTAVELALNPADPAPLRDRLKDVMAYKKRTQPMGEPSAGCVFKNPTVDPDLAERLEHKPADGPRRVSAGMLLDRAGCKGLRAEGGGARISDFHANFVVTEPGARARDVIDLMRRARQRVLDAFGVSLEPEVVIWRRNPTEHLP